MEHESELNALEWRAFRYVSGEMTADEARELEEQMATDQSACEAVSRAVALGRKLTDARPAVEPVVTPTDRSQVKQTSTWSWQGTTLVWAAMATAASVAFFLGTFWGRHEAGDEPIDSPRVASSGNTEAVVNADAWLQLHQMNRGEAQAEQSWNEWEADEPAAPEIDRGPVVPAWLVEMAGANRAKEKP